MPHPLPLRYRALRQFGRQDWVRYGLRGHLLRRFVQWESITPRPFEVNLFGSRYRGDLGSYLDWHIYFYGAYEKHILLLLRDLVRARSRPVFLDIGANTGQHTLVMSQCCAHVHAFEPYAPVRAQLEENLRLNATRNVTVHPVGFGAEDAALPYYAPTGRNTGVGSFVAAHAPDSHTNIGELPIAHGDTYLAAAGVTQVDCIKIDVEGFERERNAGVRETLQRCRPAVVMEFGESTARAVGSLAALKALLPPAYTIAAIIPRRPWGMFFNVERYALAPFDFAQAGYLNILLQPAPDIATEADI